MWASHLCVYLALRTSSSRYFPVLLQDQPFDQDLLSHSIKLYDYCSPDELTLPSFQHHVFRQQVLLACGSATKDDVMLAQNIL